MIRILSRSKPHVSVKSVLNHGAVDVQGTVAHVSVFLAVEWTLLRAVDVRDLLGSTTRRPGQDHFGRNTAGFTELFTIQGLLSPPQFINSALKGLCDDAAGVTVNAGAWDRCPEHAAVTTCIWRNT